MKQRDILTKQVSTTQPVETNEIKSPKDKKDISKPTQEADNSETASDEEFQSEYRNQY